MDVDATGVSRDSRMRAAVGRLTGVAPRPLKEVRLTQSAEPVSERTPHFVELCFPVRYPYGTGGPELDHTDRKRRVFVSDQANAKRCLMLTDRGFATHESWMFVTFNRIQRSASRLHSGMVASSSGFVRDARSLNSIDAKALIESLNKLDLSKPHTELPLNDPSLPAVNTLLRRVKMVQGRLPGTNEARAHAQSKLFSMAMFFGCSTFFITLNPSDTNNPLCMYFAGVKLDLRVTAPDLPVGMPGLLERANIVSRNPVASTQFFHTFVAAFLRHLIGFGKPRGGVYGRVVAYAGAVETQGRGTEHLHLNAFLKDSPNPAVIFQRAKSEPDFKRKLLGYLEQCICESLHPLEHWHLPVRTADSHSDRLMLAQIRNERASLPPSLSDRAPPQADSPRIPESELLANMRGCSESALIAGMWLHMCKV